MSVLTLYAVMQLLMPFLCTCLHSIFPFSPACALHTCLCHFFLHLFVHSHPFVALSLYCIFYINILINLHIIINIIINSYLFCLNFHNRASFSEMVKTRGSFGWVSTPYIDLSHKMSPVVKVSSKAINNCSRVSPYSFRL